MALTTEQKKQASQVLGGLDKCAQEIETHFDSLGLPQHVAKQMINHLDRVADGIEAHAFGEASLQRRQVEVLKQAKVIQQDSDESYMRTFNAPMAPHQTDGDEPYMAAYKDDQSQAVATGKSTTGRPLSP